MRRISIKSFTRSSGDAFCLTHPFVVSYVLLFFCSFLVMLLFVRLALHVLYDLSYLLYVLCVSFVFVVFFISCFCLSRSSGYVGLHSFVIRGDNQF